MHSYSDYKIEYWVKDQDDALVQRFSEDALYHARQTAEVRSGRVYEVVLDLTLEGMGIVSEMEI
jgi:hypothetical protein